MDRKTAPRFVALAVGLALCLGCEAGERPVATRGTLELSGHALESEPVALDGEWELYWDQLLSPEDFGAAETRAPSSMLRLPGSWQGHEVDGRPLDGTGQATLRLRILPASGESALMLRLHDVASAWRLWANGRLLAEDGVVGRSVETEVPSLAVRLVRLPDAGGPIELLLQVSNHHRPAGGVTSSIRLGTEARLVADQIAEWTVATFFVGILLAMGLYHLVLFGFRRKNVAPLAFGLYCLLWMGTYLTNHHSGWAIRLHLSDLPSLALEQASLVCFYLTLPVTFWFLRTLYPQEFSRRMLQVAVGLTPVFVGLTLAFPVWSLSRLLPLCYGWSFVLIAYCFARLAVALRRGRRGAGYILAGFLLLGLLSINDMLVDLQLIRSVFLIHAGMVLFVAFQALALAHQFSHSFTAVESLSVQLEATNLAQQQEMAERARLEREIVDTSEQERRLLSRALHDGLCQQLTGARLRCSAIEQRLARSGDEPADLAQLSGLLERSVVDAYGLARGLWPVDGAPDAGGAFLEDLGESLARSSGIAIEVRQSLACAECDGAHVGQLARIGQEAMLNAVKHSKARRMGVTLECRSDERCLRLTVEDDGVGRAVAARSQGGLGMRIMAHRASLIEAELSVTDTEGGGTRVVCTARCQRQLADSPAAVVEPEGSKAQGG